LLLGFWKLKRRALHYIAVCAMGLLFYISLSTAHAMKSENELKLKTAYLYNFTKFTHWPEDLKIIKICISVDHPISKSIQSLHEKKSNDKVIEIETIKTEEEVHGCNLIYLSGVSQDFYQKVMGLSLGKPIVTIKDIDEYKEVETMITLFEENKRLRFQINIDKAKESGVVFSSKLLKYSEQKK